MKQDEIEIMRAMSAYLDKDTIFVLTYQYHTEKDQTEPSGQKNDRSKSRYRMLGRIMKKADMEEAVYRMHSDENALKPWIWPDDPSWNGRILYMYDSNQKAFSNWLARFAKSTPESEKYVRLNPNSAYIVKGYTCSDGDVIDITDRETLLKKVGQNVWFEIPLRSQAEKRS